MSPEYRRITSEDRERLAGKADRLEAAMRGEEVPYFDRAALTSLRAAVRDGVMARSRVGPIKDVLDRYGVG